jgi:site-specific recombinase XerD
MINLVETGSDLELILEGQKTNHKNIPSVYLELANKNIELVALNKELQQKLRIALKELNKKEKDALKETPVNRKRLHKRNSITPNIYQRLIKASKGVSYVSTRSRIAFCILTMIGIRINQLLPLKVYQLQNLLKLHWIGINCPKRDTSSQKAFLTDEGKEILKNRKKDFEVILVRKEPDSYIFTSDFNHYQMLSRETLTKDVNTILRLISYPLHDQPNITSHSFRVGYILQLWKDTKDIRFVRQVVKHRNIALTSSYVEIVQEPVRIPIGD